MKMIMVSHQIKRLDLAQYFAIDYQPAYVEFAAIFLFVLVLIYRYDLSTMDLGISTDSFVSRFVNESHSAQHIDNISAEQSKKISVWFKGLLNEDSIDDEILSTCKPQEFYLFQPSSVRYSTPLLQA
jgi:mediator of RNA polymerase II transcription subunit 5